MSEGEQMGRCFSEVHECRGSPSELKIASAIDRLAADLAAVRAKVDAVAPEDVRHFVESEKAWVRLVEEKETAAIRERDEWKEEARLAVVNRDEARAEVARLRGEVEDSDRLIDQLIVGNEALARERDEARAEAEKLRREITAAHKGTGYTPDQSDWLMAGAIDRLAAELAARQAANHPGTLDSSPAAPQPAAPPPGWLTEEERELLSLVVTAILARAGSPPVVVLPTVFARSRLGDELVALQQVKDSLDKAGVSWKEVPRGQDLK